MVGTVTAHSAFPGTGIWGLQAHQCGDGLVFL